MKKIVFLLFSALIINYCPFINGMNDPNSQIMNYDLFKAVRQIREIVVAAANKHHVHVNSIEQLDINPRFCQTKDVILLKVIVENNLPAKLSTPWGVVNLVGVFFNDDQFKPVTDELLSQLKTELLKDGPNRYGVHLRAYKVLAVNGVALPISQEQDDTERYHDEAAIQKAWNELESRYKKSA